MDARIRYCHKIPPIFEARQNAGLKHPWNLITKSALLLSGKECHIELHNKMQQGRSITSVDKVSVELTDRHMS